MHLVSLWIPIKAVPVNYMYVHELLTGRHPCLWCEIRADEMSTPASMREPSKPRSLQSLEADYSAFVAAGGDIRRAKNYNNVIAPYFFKITLDQVYTCIHTCTHAITTTNSSTCPYYRTTFPGATVTPKFHMLEEHVLPFLKKWRVGFGFHGEQGAEALHRGFNRIKASYTSIHDPLKRLLCVVREHHLQVSPVLVAQEPAKKKRRTL